MILADHDKGWSTQSSGLGSELVKPEFQGEYTPEIIDRVRPFYFDIGY